MLRASHEVAIGLAIAATVSAVSGCRSTPRLATEPCIGTEYLVVRNDSRDMIDVLERRGASSYDVIGTVGSGVSELQFPSGRAPTEGIAARRVSDGRWVAIRNGGTRGSVSFDIACNAAR